MPNDTLQSMTGFGSAENEVLSVEIRSVNHRYFDVFFRMPGFLNRFEIELKKMLKEAFSRGRFEVNITVNSEKVNELKINDELVSGIIDVFNHIKEKYSVSGEVSIEMLAGFRDIMITNDIDFDESRLYVVFGEALKKLSVMRHAEGSHIKGNLYEMLKNVSSYVDVISGDMTGIVEKLRERYMAKMEDLLQKSAVDENRLVQEASIQAERADISEELTRLESHIKQFEDILEGGGPIGRKLDFLLQEFYREANTIASKTSELNVVSVVVDLKNEIEKLREQVQNIQ